MSKRIVPHNQDLRNQAISLVCNGQVSRDGKDGQCFVQTDTGLYLANATACTCSEQPCAHTLAAELYNWARQAVGTLMERNPTLSITRAQWLLEDGQEATTNPATADKLAMGIAICEQLHREMLAAARSEPRQSSYPVPLNGLTRQDGRNWSMSGRERRR